MCSLPPRLEKALRILSETLSGIGARWVLVGSTASCLNGVEVQPKDIDVIVESGKAYEVDSVFASRFRVLRRVKYSSSEVYSSHYGVFEIQGVKVEVMAGLKICGEPGCLKVEFDELYRYSKSLRIGNTGLRIAPLEWQLVANTLIPGKEKRVAKILEALNTKGVNAEILDNVLGKAPQKTRKHVIELLINTHKIYQ